MVAVSGLITVGAQVQSRGVCIVKGWSGVLCECVGFGQWVHRFGVEGDVYQREYRF